MVRVSGKSDGEQHLVQVGDAIRARRQAASLSQEELADSSGLDRSHLGRIERGERNLTLMNLLRIARALDLPASSILQDAGF